MQIVIILNPFENFSKTEIIKEAEQNNKKILNKCSQKIIVTLIIILTRKWLTELNRNECELILI